MGSSGGRSELPPNAVSPGRLRSGRQDPDGPDHVRRARDKWKHDGRVRPEFADAPGPGQESVWDYPRPPRVDGESRVVSVWAGDVEIARSSRSLRVLETAGAPVFYQPPADVLMDHLCASTATRSLCEWKGLAQYWSLLAHGTAGVPVAWSYPDPYPEFAELQDRLAFFPRLLDCRVDGERATPQAGEIYGGWVTREIVGPIKGEPGTEDW